MIGKMKRLVFVTGLGIIIIGLSAFEIAKKASETDREKRPSEKITQTEIAASLPVKQMNFSKLYSPNSELDFRVNGKENHPVTTEKLKNAKKLDDIIDYYPENWVDNYESVEISAEINGLVEKADGSDKFLNKEQIRILHSAELANHINVTVKYKSKNSVTGILEASQMNVTMTVIPEKEAEFKSGYDKLIQYLKENSKNEISGLNLNLIEPAYIWFTITENGSISNVGLKKSSGNAQIDKRMIELISNMPEWNPAENANGKKVSQEFELAFSGQGNADGC